MNAHSENEGWLSPADMAELSLRLDRVEKEETITICSYAEIGYAEATNLIDAAYAYIGKKDQKAEQLLLSFAIAFARATELAIEHGEYHLEDDSGE